jgi:predicted Rossmann fold nucleotide-binding protein DprA/Smf involved in DNA uptake
LLRDGAVPVTKAQDVLDELFGIDVRRAPGATSKEARPAEGTLAAVLDAVEAGLTTDEIAAAVRLPASETRAALGRLQAEGWIVRRDLVGWERRVG